MVHLDSLVVLLNRQVWPRCHVNSVDTHANIILVSQEKQWRVLWSEIYSEDLAYLALHLVG